jgi:hypothetical protein
MKVAACIAFSLLMGVLMLARSIHDVFTLKGVK